MSYNSKYLCHPDNYDRLIRYLSLDGFRPNEIRDFFAVQIDTNDSLPIQERYGWSRTNVLPDDKFCRWVDDLNNPPDWAIHYGLVIPRMCYVYFYKRKSSYTIYNGNAPVTYTKESDYIKGYMT